VTIGGFELPETEWNAIVVIGIVVPGIYPEPLGLGIGGVVVILAAFESGGGEGLPSLLEELIA
jgi:hypothetical protein